MRNVFRTTESKSTTFLGRRQGRPECVWEMCGTKDIELLMRGRSGSSTHFLGERACGIHNAGRCIGYELLGRERKGWRRDAQTGDRLALAVQDGCSERAYSRDDFLITKHVPLLSNIIQAPFNFRY